MSKIILRVGSEVGMVMMMVLLYTIHKTTLLGVIAPLVFILLMELNSVWKNRVVQYLLTALFAAFSFWILNDLMAIGLFVGNVKPDGIINYFMYLFVVTLFFGIFQNKIVSIVVPEVIFSVVAITNLIIKAIRRTPLSAGDLYSVKTAMAVAGNYSMEFDKDFLVKLALALCIIVFTNMIVFFHLKGYEKNLKWYTKIAFIVCFGVWMVVLIPFDFISNISGKKSDYFSHESNGFALNMYLQWKDLEVKEPKGYNVEELEAYSEKYQSDFIDDVSANELPNIIVIMNESFADLRVLGDYETSQEVLPFLDGLEKNTIKGIAYSSIYGGNTANSEYEFLTGCSLSYFSERVVPFQLYMNEERPSIIKQMEDIGYDSVFMHPYRAYSWNRPSVYSALGVDQMIYEEDMDKLQYIRAYGSDESQYGYVLDALRKQNEKPLFLFDVTVQNHGGYTGQIDELPNKISITGKEGKYQETENYLALAHESDLALDKLISELKKLDKPVAVIFFGDHQPAIESGFIEMASGKKVSDFTLAERERMYQVPFFIWTNYELPNTEEDEQTYLSLNYLSSFMCKTLGLPMTGMQKMLLDMRENMPVINTVAVKSSDGEYYGLRELPEADIYQYNIYKQWIYNYMFDNENRNNSFFELRGR